MRPRLGARIVRGLSTVAAIAHFTLEADEAHGEPADRDARAAVAYLDRLVAWFGQRGKR